MRAPGRADDLLQGGESVLLGHRDVQRGELGPELLEARHGLAAVAGLTDDLVATLVSASLTIFRMNAVSSIYR